MNDPTTLITPGGSAGEDETERIPAPVASGTAPPIGPRPDVPIDRMPDEQLDELLGLESTPRSGMMSRLFWPIALVVLLAVSFSLRLINLDADAPLDASRDLSLTIDGSWYVGAEIDWASSRPIDETPGYDPPIHGVVARILFRVLGPSHQTANLIGVLFALVAIGLTAGAARRAYGDRVGIVAGLLLALSYPYFFHSRTGGVYVPLSVFAAGLLWLRVSSDGGRFSWRQLASGLILAGIAALGLKQLILLQAVALVASLEPLRAMRAARPWKAFVVTVAGGSAIGIVGLFLWRNGWLGAQIHKVTTYFLTGGGGLEDVPLRAIEAESRIGAFATEPILAVLGVLGMLYAPPGGARRFATWTVALSWGLLAVLGYSPLRYMLPAFPALAFLAGGAIAALVSERRARRTPYPRAMRCVRGLGIAYAIAQVFVAASGNLEAWEPGAIIAYGVAVGIALLFELVLVDHLPGLPRGARTALAGCCVVVAALVGLTRTGVGVAYADHSIERAGQAVREILHPAAHVTGPFAHVLTYESPHRRSFTPVLEYGGGKLGRVLREQRVTHIAVDVNESTVALLDAFRRDGAALTPVHELVLRGQRVMLYRFPWAKELVPLSDFEHGVDAMQAGNYKEARERFELAHVSHPGSTPIISALAHAVLELDEKDRALRLLTIAIELNPHEITAARTLVRLQLADGDLIRARAMLEHIVQLDPSDRQARELLERFGE